MSIPSGSSPYSGWTCCVTTLDPLAAMAEMDTAKLDELMASVQWSSEELAQTLQAMWPAGGEWHGAEIGEPPESVKKNV